MLPFSPTDVIDKTLESRHKNSNEDSSGLGILPRATPVYPLGWYIGKFFVDDLESRNDDCEKLK
jgi:hypothetical protein